MRVVVWRTLVVLMMVALASCKSTSHEDRLLAELGNLDKENLFARAEALYVEKQWDDARTVYSFVYDSFPNDPLGHKAALRIADTFFNKKHTADVTEARLRYRDFANRYPNDPDRDYALLMLGNTYTHRRLKPDRDLSSLNEALNAYQQLVNLYPNSEHAPEAQEKTIHLRALLAEHEWLVARYYARNKMWAGARSRLEYLKENYPDYAQMEEVDAMLESINSAITDLEAAFKARMEMQQKGQKVDAKP